MNKKKLGIGFFVSLSMMQSSAFAQVNPESVIQILQRLDVLEKKAQNLTGQNEVLKNQIDQLKKAQKQGFLSVDEQIDVLRNNMSTNSSAQTAVKKPEAKAVTPNETVVAVAAKPVEPKPAAVTNTAIAKTDGVKTIPPTAEETASKSSGKIREPSAYEKETYQKAFNKMSSSPTAATNAFKDYIKLQPKSPLAANAQYWIGEIMYSHNNYKGAVKEFIKVLQDYKTSNKAPDAAIKLGYSFYALKNWEYARRTFEDVLKYFPDNKNAVNLATKRLEKMKAAGN